VFDFGILKEVIKATLGADGHFLISFRFGESLYLHLVAPTPEVWPFGQGVQDSAYFISE
jgi:hypothetical protein